MNENNSNSTEKLILKIVVPIMLVCVVVGIWAVKNVQKVKDASDNTTVAQINSSGNSDSNSNPDFAYSVTDELDMDKLKSYKLPIIIEFGAEWCAPCKQMAPIITALNKELRGKAIVRFVNTDENQAATAKYNFQYIPTQLFIKADGTPYNPANAAEMQMDLKYDPDTNELMYTTHTGTLTKEDLLSILTEMGMK